MKNRKKIFLHVFVGLLVLCELLFLCGCTRKAEEPDADMLEEFLEETEALPEMTAEGEAETKVKTDTDIEAVTEKEAAEPKKCYVHICGAVKNPGVYCMEQGNRVFEVIEAAGGFTADACMDYVNQADALSDGLMLWVPTKEEAEEIGWRHPQMKNGESADAGSKGLVNINTAASSELCSLSGIGEAKAEAIIAYREAHGGFTRKEDIMKVAGIKQSGYEKIKEQICVGQE